MSLVSRGQGISRQPVYLVIIFRERRCSIVFNSIIYSEELSQYYTLRSAVLSDSARKHELCYLKSFDTYLFRSVPEKGNLSERVINAWVETVHGKSSSIEMRALS